jgi:hypothetical protein
MVGVGVGVLAVMSIPAMLGSMVGVGVGVLPDMSIPAISPWSAVAGAGELADMSIPGIADDIGLEASMITPNTALAAARTTVAITMRRVTLMLAIEQSFPRSLCRPDGGGRLGAVALEDCRDYHLRFRRNDDHRCPPLARERPAAQVSWITVSFTPRDSPGDSMKIP